MSKNSVKNKASSLPSWLEGQHGACVLRNIMEFELQPSPILPTLYYIRSILRITFWLIVLREG